MKIVIHLASPIGTTRRIARFDRASSLARPLVWLVLACLVANATQAAEARELNVLFIGHSFTARHALTQVIKSLAEEGQPGLHFRGTTVIYGGRTLADHTELQSLNFIRQTTIAPSEVEASIGLLRELLTKRTAAHVGHRGAAVVSR